MYKSNLKFHHIGIATVDLTQTAKLLELFGYKPKGEKKIDHLQNVEVLFLSSKNMPLLELLGGVNDQSPIMNILKNNGTTPYHICFSTSSIDQAIDELRQDGYIPLGNRKKSLIDDHNVLFWPFVTFSG